MDAIRIRNAELADIDKLQSIGRQTFFETFSAGNSAENMEQYLRDGFSTEKLLEELTNPMTKFYFAEEDNQVIGYLKVNVGTAQTELQDNNALEIERIYVLKAYHGKQVGQLLYEKAIEIARSLQVHYVWLGVWEENPRAIRFYEKNGFVAFDKHVFTLGTDEQTDIMMKLELK
ncbi:MAG TPA: GNAT family N-acetyltransferase [Chitinophagales bacterium]|nr:GNAT family N-acetyltransferase [Chitinophagales bacterium]